MAARKAATACATLWSAAHLGTLVTTLARGAVARSCRVGGGGNGSSTPVEELPASDELSPNEISDWIRRSSTSSVELTDADMGLSDEDE